MSLDWSERVTLNAKVGSCEVSSQIGEIRLEF